MCGHPNATSEPERLQVCKTETRKTVIKTRMDGRSSF